MKKKSQLTKALLYARISVEENGERHSIENQIEIIKNYAQSNNFEIVEMFIDDGYSGGTLARPGLEKLLESAKANIAKTIIVKDLSRLARNYLEMGNLIENVFPKYNIRFIAITDNVDSSLPIDDFVVIKNYMNEYYIRELSRKTKRHYLKKAQHDKLSRGVYGYKTNPETKQTEIDPDSAIIVKHIFNSFINGHSMGQIAKELTNQKVFVPGYYKYITIGSKAGICNMKNLETDKYKWTHSMVSLILHRIEYTGTAVNYRFLTIKKKKIPRDTADWIYLDNIYPTIISKKTYEKAKSLFNDSGCFKKNTEPHLTKILLDSNNKALIYNTTDLKKAIYQTRDKKQYIDANDLHTIILADIKSLLQQFVDGEKKLISNLKRLYQKKDYNFDKLKIEKDNLINNIEILFEQKLNTEISEETYNSEIQKLNSKVLDLEKLIEKEETKTNNLLSDYKINEFIKLLKGTSKKIDIDLIYHLVSKITVSFIDKKSFDIQINYKFIDN